MVGATCCGVGVFVGLKLLVFLMITLVRVLAVVVGWWFDLVWVWCLWVW